MNNYVQTVNLYIATLLIISFGLNILVSIHMHIQLMIIVLWLQYNYINIIGFDHACLTYAMQLYV